MKHPLLPHAHDAQADLEPIVSGLHQAERFETVRSCSSSSAILQDCASFGFCAIQNNVSSISPR